MTTSNGARPGRQTFVEVARGPLVVGLPVGAAVGALVGVLTHDNLVGGLALGAGFALVVVGFLVTAEIRAGAMGVPHRRPFRPGDRFAGWTVVGRLRTGFGHTVEYEVRHGDNRGRLTVLAMAYKDSRRQARRVPHPLAEIGSSYLAQPMDIGRAGQFEYVVTELDRGELLAARVLRQGSLDGTTLFHVAAGTALALREIHARDAVHGQVRPDQVVVSDARVALLAFDPLVNCQGGDEYLAPEQTLGDDSGSAKADVFSWACTVFFAATGRAFEPATEPDLELCPHWLRAILAAALADEPADRPESTALIERLRVVGREFGWQLPRPDPPRPPDKPAPRMATRTAVAGLASVVLAAVLPIFVPANPDGGSPATSSSTLAVEVPTLGPTTPAMSTAATPTSSSDEPTSTDVGSGWPVDANDGSPAFLSDLGDSFLVPDWVACAGEHCVVGSGDQVYLFTQQPTTEVAHTDLAVDDPASALTDMGLTPREASELLAR
jgi:hypothetical protein